MVQIREEYVEKSSPENMRCMKDLCLLIFDRQK